MTGGLSIEGVIFGDAGVAITYLHDDELDDAEITGVLITHQIQVPLDLSPEVREMILQIQALASGLVQLAQEVADDSPQMVPSSSG